MKTFTIYSSCIILVLLWPLHLNHFHIYITHSSSIFSNTCKYKPERLRYFIENFEYLSESMYSAWLVGLVSSVFITIQSLVITYLSWENNNGNVLSSYFRNCEEKFWLKTVFRDHWRLLSTDVTKSEKITLRGILPTNNVHPPLQTKNCPLGCVNIAYSQKSKNLGFLSYST